MIATDPIRSLHHLLQAGGRPHMDRPLPAFAGTSFVDDDTAESVVWFQSAGIRCRKHGAKWRRP